MSEEESFNSIFDYLAIHPSWSKSFLIRAGLKGAFIKELIRGQSIVMKTMEDTRFVNENYKNEKVFIENLLISWINVSYKYMQRSIATLIYVFYFYRGYIDRKKFILSADIENYFVRGTGVPTIYFDLFDMFGNNMHGLKKIINYLVQVVRQKVEFSKSPGFKRGLKIILKSKFIKNLNLLLSHQIPKSSYISELFHHTKQHKLIIFLIELRLKSEKKALLSSHEKAHFRDKFRIDLDELETIYLISTRRCFNDFLKDLNLAGGDPESAAISREFLYIENKIGNTDTTVFTKSFINDSSFFKKFGLNSPLCWHGIFLQKKAFELAFQTFPKTSIEKLHNGLMNSSLIIDLVELCTGDLVKKNKNLLMPKFDTINIRSKEECSQSFSKNLTGVLGYSPMMYMLMNAGDIAPETLFQKFFYAYEPEKLNFFTFYVYLNLKSIDIFKLEFIFDYLYFKRISLYANTLKKQNANLFKDKKNISSLKFNEDQMRRMEVVIDSLYQYDELFLPVALLKNSMNKTEKLIFQHFIKLVPSPLKNATDEEKVNYLIGNYLFSEWVSRSQDDEVRVLGQSLLAVEPFTDPISSFIRDPSKADHNYWEAIISNTYFLKSFLKFMKDELLDSIRKLNKTPKADNSKGDVGCVMNSLNFEAGVFILMLSNRLRKFKKLPSELIFENFNQILLGVDILFKVIDKVHFFCSCGFLTNKENAIKFYLLSIGVVIKPAHITTFSASLYNPLSVLYLQSAFAKNVKSVKLTELLQALKTANPCVSFIARLQTLNKIVKNDKKWIDINGNFRNFIFIPKKGIPLTNSNGYQVNLKLDSREIIESTNLFDYDLHHDEKLIDQFYLIESICKFEKKSKYQFYLKLERSFYYATYYQISLLQTRNIRKKYRLSTVEDLLEFHFGKATTNVKFWKNVKLLNLSYFDLYKRMRIFRFKLKNVFEPNFYHVDYRKLNEETRVHLKTIHTLQIVSEKFNELSLFESLKSLKIKSDIGVISEFLRFLFSNNSNGDIIRDIRHI
jgi:hypothetical protein